MAGTGSQTHIAALSNDSAFQPNLQMHRHMDRHEGQVAELETRLDGQGCIQYTNMASLKAADTQTDKPIEPLAM